MPASTIAVTKLNPRHKPYVQSTIETTGAEPESNRATSSSQLPMARSAELEASGKQGKRYRDKHQKEKEKAKKDKSSSEKNGARLGDMLPSITIAGRLGGNRPPRDPGNGRTGEQRAAQEAIVRSVRQREKVVRKHDEKDKHDEKLEDAWVQLMEK